MNIQLRKTKKSAFTILSLLVLFTSNIVVAGQGRPINGPELSGNSIPKTSELNLVTANEVDKVTRKCMVEAAKSIYEQLPKNMVSVDIDKIDSCSEYTGTYNSFTLNTCDSLLLVLENQYDFEAVYENQKESFQERHLFSEIFIKISSLKDEVNSIYNDMVYLRATSNTGEFKDSYNALPAQNFTVPYVEYDRDINHFETDIFGRKVKKISSAATLLLKKGYSMEAIEQGSVPLIKLYNDNYDTETPLTFDLEAFNLCLIDGVNNPLSK